MTQALSSDMAATDQWWRYVLNLGGSRPEATSLPPSILLFSFPLVDSTWVWAKPAHPLPNILMQFIQSNSFIKFTLMFNVLPGTEISVQATVGKTDTTDYKAM